MEQVPDLTNSITITRSFTQERLNRINADPYGTLNRQINYPSAPASERLLNFVKGKFHGALSTVKKLLEGPKQSSNSIPLLPDSQKRLIIPNERLNGISSLIQETISKPEYQEHYDVYNHRHANNKKASFLNLLSYYKDVSADRIREKMEESNSWIIPEPVACPLKPVPSRGTMVPVKSRGGLRKKYSRKASHSSNNSSMVIMNGKRELNSILSSKDKKTKDKKRVSFKPEYQRSTSSMIRYMSSDEEENGMYNEDSTDKKVILEDQSMSKESPTLRLSIIAKRKAKINPFQKKNLAEKLSNSQLLRSEKLAKKPNGGKFYMDNSFISDNHVNDSKLETDSDESNILQPSPEHHNAREPEDFNTNKKIVEVSEESEKGSPKFDAPSLKRIEETGKPSSPSLEDNEIEEQKMEKEEPHPEEKAALEIVEKPQETKGLFGNLGKTTGSLFGQAPAQGLFGNNKPEEKPSLSRKDSPEVPAQPSLFNLNNSSPKQAENAIPQQVSAPEPEIQEVVTEKPVESENAEEAAKVSYEEALKNPIFANVVSKKDDSVKMNNPFLNPTSAPSRGFNSLVSDIVQENAEVPVQETNNAAPAPDNNPFLQRNQSVGILGILQSSQSAAPANTGGLFNNTLKPIGSMSWMNSNNSDQGTKNLFGGLGALSQPQAPAPSQPSIFGQGFSGGMNNEENMMQNTGNSLFNNNSAGSSLFGGGSMQMQGNSGAGLFGGNNLGGGMNTLNQEAMNSNPFLAGLGGGFGGNNQGGGGMMRASSFSLDSGKKRGSQRERAF